MPIEVALLVVGSQSVGSVPALLVGIVLLTAADLLGMTILHVAARIGGVKLLARLTARHEARTEAAMARLRGWFGGRDALAVFVLRLVPVVRVGITIGTGLLRIRPRDFYLGALPASVVWAGAPLTLGFVLRDDVAALESGAAAAAEALPIAGLGAVVVLVVLLLAASGRRRLAARRARERSFATSPSPSPPPPSVAGPERRPAPDLR